VIDVNQTGPACVTDAALRQRFYATIGRMPGLSTHKEIAAWCADAQRALADRDYPRAHQWCMRILERDPNYADAFFVLALIAADHNNFAKAADVLGRAIRLDAVNPRYHAHLARCLVALNRPGDAHAAATLATDLAPNDALTLDTIGVVYSRTGYHGDAVPLFERAAAAVPNNASYQYNLAAARQFAGDFAGAERAYRQALALDPNLYRAHSALAQLSRATPDDNQVAQLEALFDEHAKDADATLHVGHALARQWEDLHDYPRSFDWLIRATRLKRQQLAYAPAADAANFAAAAATAQAVHPSGFASDEPIFVIGMPRTGTTLVDRILSSHPNVLSAGELTNFALIIKRLTATPSNLVLDAPTLAASTALDFNAVGAAYIASTRPRTGAHKHFIDKMPLNFFYAALIQRALPNARIICLRRNPMDTCLSNFRQLFATSFSYYNYAYDLLDAGRYYIEFDALIARWRQTLPSNRFIEVQYETLVTEQEAQSRRLVDFCGLDWNDACLDFHHNEMPVATASSVQVRRPMYKTSVGRWTRYGDRLDRLRDLFDTAHIDY
jgi:Flp pilus assembly protein TadD